jgi:DNA-binding response OmpR family regulator
LERLRQNGYDLVILDIMLPGLDGLTLLKALRRESRNTDVPVLLLTARREESDKVLGLESGADDYLAKPFGVRELMARARALMRRPRATGDPAASGKPAVVRDLEVDPARRRATVGGREVELTSHEFDLLYLLASHPGVVFSREALLARIWKGDTFVTDRSVDALVKRVRKKIEPDQSEPTYVLTVWGTGYKCVDE